MTVPQPRRDGNRLPPLGEDEFFPEPTIIGDAPAQPLPPRRNPELPDMYYFPAPMPAGEPVRVIPPKAEDAEIHVIELKHATPAAMSLHVKKFFDSAEVSIDEDTGSLVIRCGKKTLEDIKKLVEKLDKPSKRGGA